MARKIIANNACCYIAYKVVTNSDLTEGRGGPVSLGFFTTKASANALAKGNGVMGTDAKVEPRKTIVVSLKNKLFRLGDEVHRIYDKKEEIKKHALLKLSKDELEALGLKDNLSDYEEEFTLEEIRFD